MSKEVTAENMLRVFPAALASSENLYALASAIAEELNTLFEQNELLAIYTRINSLPEALLDILARDYKVDWYLPEAPVESKRAQIASSFTVHRHLGTKSALYYALHALYPETEIKEWFEYGGKPYHFKIVCDLTNQTLPISFDDIIRVANAIKPVRAVLDYIVYNRAFRQRLVFGFAGAVGADFDAPPAAVGRVSERLVNGASGLFFHTHIKSTLVG